VYPQVVSRCFALSNSVFPQVTGPFAAGSIPGSSTSVYAGRRGISELPPRRWHGPLGGFGFIGPCDGVMAGREVSSAFRQIRVVDYAFQPAAIARHWAQHALRGTDARRPAVRRAPHDGGATCSMCRRLLPVLADAASTGPTSPLPPDVGFTRARHGRGSDRVDRQLRVGGSAERTLMSSRRWSPRIGQHEAATGRRSPVNQNGRDIGGLLPTGTVTLLAADVDSSSRLREADPTR
jgi:hypothetical protein